jgi:hypothetical protein
MSLDHQLYQLHDWRIVGVVATTSEDEHGLNDVSTQYRL